MLKRSTLVLPAAMFTLAIAAMLAPEAASQNQATRYTAENQLQVMQQSGEFKVLEKPVDLPNFPTGGGQFLWGNVRYKESGSEVALRYAMAEPSSAVLQWYRQALTNAKWTLGKGSSRSVTARFKTYSVDVMTFPSNSPEHGCQLYIVYNLPKETPGE